MKKSAIRKKLYRRGYKLVTLKDAYGVPGYAVYDPSLSLLSSSAVNRIL